MSGTTFKWSAAKRKSASQKILDDPRAPGRNVRCSRRHKVVAYWHSHRKRLAMPHPVVHFEIGCKDKETTAAFYQQVFGWAIDGAMGLINTGSTAGIAGHIASLGH